MERSKVWGKRGRDINLLHPCDSPSFWALPEVFFEHCFACGNRKYLILGYLNCLHLKRRNMYNFILITHIARNEACSLDLISSYQMIDASAMLHR